MRTKTLLLTAALSAAGVIASMAAGVTSINVVGYINVSVPAGFSMIANQLVAAADTIDKLIPAPPDGTVVYSFNNGFVADPFNLFGDSTWDDPTLKLGPGAGVLIYNATATAFPITFVGEVKQGSLTTAITPNAFQFVSSQVPQEGAVSALGFTPTDGDVLFKWEGGFSAYTWNLFGDSTWDPKEPTLAVGEAALMYSTSGNDWTRSFVVP